MSELEFFPRTLDNPSSNQHLLIASEYFAIATAAVRDIKNNNGARSNVLFSLVEDHVACGLDPRPYLRRLEGLSERGGRLHTQTYIDSNLMLAYAIVGDSEAVFNMVRKGLDRKTVLAEDIIGAASYLAKRKGDPAIITNTVPLIEQRLPDGLYRSYFYVARKLFDLSGDPIPMLVKAQAARDNISPRQPFLDQGDVQFVKAFAQAGRIDLAQAILLQKRGETDVLDRQFRRDGLKIIAEQYLAIGYREKAMETASLSGDESLELEILSKMMVREARAGDQFSDQDYEDIVDRGRKVITIPQMLSTFFSCLGKVKAITRENPAPLYNDALDTVLEIDDGFEQAFTYRDVARDVDESGYDATPVIELALSATDKTIPFEGEPDYVEKHQQVLVWQEIADFCLEKGYLSQVRKVIKRLRDIDKKAILLSRLARAEFLAARGFF